MFTRNRDNRRAEMRIQVDKPATVKVLTGAAPDLLDATLIDLSPTGAGLRLSVFIMRGLPIEVEWLEGTIRGRVEYCRALNTGGYKLGMRLE